VTEPIFWLACSFLLVAIAFTVVLVAAIPALQELARAARSAEKLFDTLHRELPPTLEAIRLTGLEISDLTDDLSEGVESAGSVVKQVDRGLRTAQQQVQDVGVTTRSVLVGLQAAWKTLMRSPKKRRRSGVGYSRSSAKERPQVPYDSWERDRSETVAEPLQIETAEQTQAPEFQPITEALETFPEDSESLSSDKPTPTE
jgi:uncharacterized protein YoxC